LAVTAAGHTRRDWWWNNSTERRPSDTVSTVNKSHATAVELIVERPPTPLERDGVWAIAGPEVYLLVVEESGWTPEQYEAWVAQTLQRVIPRS
jgi:hypothetical protein